MADLYNAGKALMAAAQVTAPAITMAQAPTNYGDDFRIPPGEALWQIVLTPEAPYRNSNLTYPRAVVTVRVYFYADSLANEESFLHTTVSAIADEWLDVGQWQAEAGVYGFQPGIEPEVADGGREGNVITIEASAVVLAAAL